MALPPPTVIRRPQPTESIPDPYAFQPIAHAAQGPMQASASSTGQNCVVSKPRSSLHEKCLYAHTAQTHPTSACGYQKKYLHTDSTCPAGTVPLMCSMPSLQKDGVPDRHYICVPKSEAQYDVMDPQTQRCHEKAKFRVEQEEQQPAHPSYTHIYHQAYTNIRDRR